VARRLVQTAVIFLILAAATAAALLGVSLLTNANELFYNAVAAHHGADVSATVDAGKATAAQLAGTRDVPGVTQAAGPYPMATVTLTTAGPGRQPAGNRHHGTRPGHRGGRAAGQGGQFAGPPLSVVGRASRGGPLDHLVLMQGHWLTGPGQIVLAPYTGFPAPLGSKVTVTSAPGKPQLTVVGYAGSDARFGDSWVVPGQVAALRQPGAPAAAQMLYTFTRAATAQQIHTGVRALESALPPGTVTGDDSWLGSADQTSAEQSVNTPYVVAFALIGLGLAVLIVTSVVSGAVVAGYRRIGVLKSIGFTPLQVAGAYIAQIGMPALAGVAAGTVLGNVWVAPMLNVASGLFKVGVQHVPLWINVTVPVGMCVLTGLAALAPALRAGRLSAVAAIAAGQAPPAGRGYGAHRLAGRLPLPRPVTAGLAAPFSRPARSAVTMTAILFGVTAVIVAVGLYSSLGRMTAATTSGQGQVQVGLANGGPAQTFTAGQSRAIAAALRAQPGTWWYTAQADIDSLGGTGLAGTRPAVSVPGVPELGVTAYDGSSARLGWQLLSGRWYRGPGEADVNTAFLTQTGLRVGDTVTVTVNGRPVAVRIAGEIYHVDVPCLLTSWQTLGGAADGLQAWQYDVGIRAGVSPPGYLRALNRALGPAFTVSLPEGGGGISQLADTALIRLLTELVAVLAGLGVLNSVLMATRERVHDLGIFKALGMTPRQTLTMVSCWVVAPAVAASIIAIPTAIAVHAVTVQAIGAEIGTGIPGSIVAVYRPAQLILLALSGLAIAAAGALLPAGWAAGARTVTALRAE
jgi:putative ABC transport system permease protein